MKKNFVVLMLLALLAGIAQADDYQLITNSDFESGTFVAGGIPEGWSGMTGTVWFSSVSAYYNYDYQYLRPENTFLH